MGDPINHPPHYNVGKIEVIDAIEDWRLGFNLGNAVKYIARAEHKGKRLEDLRKAWWYLEREINRVIDQALGDAASQPLESPDDFVVATPSTNADGEIEWTGETVQLAGGETVRVPNDPGPNAPFAERISAYLTRQILDDLRSRPAVPARQFHSTQIAEAIGVTPRTKQYNSMCSALTKLVRQRRITRVRRGMYMGKFRQPKKPATE